MLAVAQHELVERRRWLTHEQFLESYSVAQLLPGPNVVNLALMLGDRFFGWRGAFSALAGMLCFPLLICLMLAAGYEHYAGNPLVAGALRGMGAVSAGLLLGMSIKLALALRGNPLGPIFYVPAALATLIAIAWLRLPLLWVLGSFGTLAWALAVWRIRAQRSAP